MQPFPHTIKESRGSLKNEISYATQHDNIEKLLLRLSDLINYIVTSYLPVS